MLSDEKLVYTAWDKRSLMGTLPPAHQELSKQLYRSKVSKTEPPSECELTHSNGLNIWKYCHSQSLRSFSGAGRVASVG